MMKFGLVSLPLSLLLMDYWYLCMWKSIYVLFADWSQISQTNSASAESFGGTSFPFMPCSSWPVHTSTDIHILDVNCCSSEQSHEPRHSPFIHLSRRSKKKPSGISPQSWEGIVCRFVFWTLLSHSFPWHEQSHHLRDLVFGLWAVFSKGQAHLTLHPLLQCPSTVLKLGSWWYWVTCKLH